MSFIREVRNTITDFRKLGQKMVEERITIVQTDDHVPQDMLTALVKSHCKFTSPVVEY